MKPIALLMIEHRLIEKMVGLLEKEAESIASGNKVNIPLILDSVDFFRTYADKTHHGKEEDILFKWLAPKDLKEDHRKLMDDLVKEHIVARNTVKALAESARGCSDGVPGSSEEIHRLLKALVNLYPSHIKKEDRSFFIPVMGYFGDEEQKAMLERFYEFDRGMIHEKYRQVVKRYG